MISESFDLKNTAREIAERSKKNRKAIDQCLLLANENIEPSNAIGNNFEYTIRHRGLFTPVIDKNGKEIKPLAFNLLGVEPNNVPVLHRILDGKNILAIGGGRSLEDLTTSSEFRPASLLNVDPYLPDENPGRNEAGYYRSTALDPTKKDFLAGLQKEGGNMFEEIWSTYSVPHYCKNPEEIAVFFQNMYETLAPGGKLRIFPIVFYLGRGRMQPLLITGLSRALNELAKKPDIELSVLLDPEDTSLGTLEVHKLENQGS